MKFVFLGTSSGAPTTKRNVSALAVNQEQKSNWFLFDCGEGTQRQIMKAGISIAKISDIFISHLHGDHIFGLFGLIATRNLQQSNKPLNIYAPKGLKNLVENVFEVSKTNIKYDLNFHEINADSTLQLDNLRISVTKLSHGIDTYGFFLKENDFQGRFKVEKAKECGIKPGSVYKDLKDGKTVTLDDGRTFFGKDFIEKSRPGRKVFIAGDNSKPEIILNAVDSCDLLIHEATYTKQVEDNLEEKYLHSTAYAVGKTAQKMKIKNLVLTHFSGRYKNSNAKKYSMNEIKEEAASIFENKLILAKDFLKLELNRNKELSIL